MVLKPHYSTYVLAEDFMYKDITVPAGFPTDGLTYKFRFIGIFLNKFDPRFIEAAVLHDYMCMYMIDRIDDANQYFEELLPECWEKPLMVKAVNKYWELKRNGYFK